MLCSFHGSVACTCSVRRLTGTEVNGMVDGVEHRKSLINGRASKVGVQARHDPFARVALHDTSGASDPSPPHSTPWLIRAT